MIDLVQNILVQVSDFLWSYIIITVLICCAVFFTLRTRFVLDVDAGLAGLVVGLY